MKRKPPIPHQLFSRTLLSCAAAAALLPQGAWALDLAQSPPGTKEPYVAPNVIISIDDSGSMNFRLDMESASGASSQTEPNSDGTWPMTSRRDRKSTRLNSSHLVISYAVFCLKK